MNCEQVLSKLSAMLDGELSPEQMQAMQEHFDSCPECRNLMQTLRTLDRQLSDLREPAPEGLKDAVLSRIRQASRKENSIKRRWFGPGTSFGAIAALLVLLIGIGTISGRSGSLKATFSSIQTDCIETQALNALQNVATNNYEGRPEAAEKSVEGAEDSLGWSQASRGKFSDSYGLPSDFKGVTEKSIDSTADGNVEQKQASPMNQELRASCAALCGKENAMVLAYSEFDYESFCDLLAQEEPKLYELLIQAEYTEHDGLFCCKTNCGTALAIHEWLLEALSQAEIGKGSQMESSALAISLNDLDPDSGSLHRIITWTPGSKFISWPAQWPENWEQRLLQEENWGLFFPEEDFAPADKKTAYLVFP